MNHTIELGVAVMLGVALAMYWPSIFKRLTVRGKSPASDAPAGESKLSSAGSIWRRATLIGPLIFLGLVVLGLALTVPRLILPVLAIFAIGGVVGMLAIASSQIRPKK